MDAVNVQVWSAAAEQAFWWSRVPARGAGRLDALAIGEREAAALRDDLELLAGGAGSTGRPCAVASFSITAGKIVSRASPVLTTLTNRHRRRDPGREPAMRHHSAATAVSLSRYEVILVSSGTRCRLRGRHWLLP
ncbi:hypothetical protein FXF51_39480 [Nonomuraea sp. PA05]|uniref:hypothetical protein n=1 Tax=Nonomuraea sp. PA05 TaxID=2604466 RepID=UPI0011D82FA8|nr:hypothetical protein [Nonomuraea sp. PA05]TYB57582.1 hypothetical protein FXF51_39480 [Nonomuraea sp. PA05]